MDNHKENQDSIFNFDPCFGDSLSGCSTCAHREDCFTTGLCDDVPEVVSAVVIFTHADGFSSMHQLERVLEDFAEDHGISVDGDLCKSFDRLIDFLEEYEVALPVTVTDPDGDRVQVDRIGGSWHIGTEQDLEALRHLEELMTQERWGEEYFPWD